MTKGLSVPQGAALTVGAVLGTGVISLPALAAAIAGPASLVAWLGMVLLSVPLAGTFAALGARHSDAGGVSTFVRIAFGPRAAAVVGWCFYFAIPIGAPPAAMFAGGYVTDQFGGARSTAIATAAVLTGVVIALNLFGVRVSGRVQLVFAGILAVLLCTATVAALPHGHWGNATPFAPHGWTAVGHAAAVLVWAFAGWEAVASLSAEYRRPARDIPRATAAALLVIGVLYLGVAAASVLVLGPQAGRTSAPLSELLAVGLGGTARPVTMAVAVLLTLGTMNAYFAGGAKLGAAMGRDGALPAWFGRGTSVGEVPRRSLLVVSTLTFASLGATALFGVGLRAAVLATTGSFTLVYLLGTAAAVRLLPRRSWAWRGAVLSVVAVAGLLWLTGWHLLAGAAIAVAALAYQAAAVSRRAALRARQPAAPPACAAR